MSSAASDLRRFTAEEYLEMIRAGIIKAHDRVELVAGEVLTMSPQGPEHSALGDELHLRLQAAYAAMNVYIRDQKPLRCGAHGMPEPDLAVVRGAPRDYLGRHPNGDEVLLVVEIAKSSQQRDVDKAADYAHGAVPVYWLLDLDARVLHVYTRPDTKTGRFRSITTLDENDDVDVPGTNVSWRVASALP